MDLMYGSCPDYDGSLEDMIQCDLKSEMDQILSESGLGGLSSNSTGSSTSSSMDDLFLHDLHNDPDHMLFGEEGGFEEFGMHFDSRIGGGLGLNDPFDILDSLGDAISVTNTSYSRRNSTSTNSKLPPSPAATTPAVNIIKGKSGTSTNSGSNGIIGRNSRQPVNSGSNSSKVPTAPASILVTSLSSWTSILNRSEVKGISFEESCGIMVDPSSIVPASISGSTGSSSIGSETDPECLATDDESENELISGSIAAWIVPDQRGSSRSPSPAEPEFEVEEPEFILHTAGSHHHVSEPPAKKRKQKHDPQPHIDGKIYPKPGFSYSCLIAMSLKNSKTGCLPVSEIYKFMCDHFPYFKTAPSGWKNSVRHNLSLNKCFEKIEKPGNGARKGCLWALNPQKIHKMDEEVQKWSRKDPMAIRRAMSDPENLELIERGEMKKDYSGNGSEDDEEEEYSDPATPLTPAQLQARRSRTSSADSAFGDSIASPALSVSQVHAAMHRPHDQKIHIKKEDPLEFGTITNVQGNYICTTPGAQTYTLSFSNLGSTTPIIIRRTPVK